MNQYMTLNQISPGERVTVEALNCSGSMRRRLLDIGLVENTEVECVGRSPCGDPCAYLIRGAVIAIRHEDGAGISVKKKELDYGTDK